MSHTATDTTPALSAHPFAHLGPAPYRFTSASCTEDRLLMLAMTSESVLAGRQDANVSGSCDHCGMCIHDFYHFKASNGTVFKVGSVCYEKGLIDEQTYADRKALAQAKAAKTKMATKKRHSREAAKISEALEFFKANQDAMDAAPHPRFSGKSLNDYASWMWERCGTVGKIKLYKTVREALAS